MAAQVLSIVIPVRNHARPLSRLLECLSRLRPPAPWEVEIIGVYTPSTDETLRVLERYGVKIVQCAGVGPGSARNAGVAQSRGDLLYFIDADACPVGDDFLTRLIGLSAGLADFGAFGGPIMLAPEQRWNPVALADHLACWFNWHPTRTSGRTRLFQPTVSLVMRRSVFDELGGFDNSLRVLEDFELQHRLLRQRRPVYFIREFAVTHEARSSLWRSWRHSWYWGAPFRSAYIERVRDYGLRHPPGSPNFWLNLPRIYVRRMRLVMRAAWRLSRRDTVVSAPFIAMTVFAWSLGVILGRGQPSTAQAAPI